MNNVSVPNETSGWREVSFTPNHFIWIPSINYARSLIGTVNSGSYSWNALDSVGLAGITDAAEAKIRDYRRAIGLASNYMGDAISHYAAEGAKNALLGLAQMLLIGIGVLAVSSGIGAALGSLAGGVGAAPGAAAGFEVGLAILEWMGLAFLLAWVGQKLIEVGGAFATFLGTVWSANGDESIINQGAMEFADAVGRLIGALVEGLVMLGGARGVKFLFSSMKGTRVEQTFSEGRAGRWLTERVNNVRNGRGPLRTPRNLANPQIGNFRGLKNRNVSDVLARIPREAQQEHFRPIAGGATQGAKYKWVQDGKTYRLRFHNADPSAPAGSNASQGWIFRVQQGGKYMDSNGTFHRPGVNNTRSPHYDPVLANDSHIPIVRDVNPGSHLNYHPSATGGAIPTQTDPFEND